MKLLQLGRYRWEVLAALDTDGSCPTLDGLPAGKSTPMMALLRETVPTHGPEPLRNTDLMAPLRNEILEFRKNPKGAKIRVLWFYGETNLAHDPLTIVCTHSFMKKTQKTPNGEIDRAIKVRQRYFADEKRDANEVFDLDDTRLR